MTKRQQAHALITKFEKLWKKQYGKDYVGNRHADRWGFEDMITDLGYDESQKVVEYYFNLGVPGHPRSTLLYRYDELSDQRKRVENYKARQRELMEATERLVNEG